MHIGIPMWTMLTYFLLPVALYLSQCFFWITQHCVSQRWNWKQKPFSMIYCYRIQNESWFTQTHTHTLAFKSLRLEPIHLPYIHSLVLVVWGWWHFDIKTYHTQKHNLKCIALCGCVRVSPKCFHNVLTEKRDKKFTAAPSPLRLFKVEVQTIFIMSKLKFRN